MPLPKLVRSPLKWLYCLAIVIVGFAGRAHLVRWEEDWSKPLPLHQVEYYVRRVREGDTSTIDKLLSLAHDESPLKRSTAMYLLDSGGAIHRLDRQTRVSYWVLCLSNPVQFAIYQKREPDATPEARRDAHRRRLEQLWQNRDLADPIALRYASTPSEFAYSLRDSWATQWVFVTDRAKLTRTLLNYLGVAAATIRVSGGMNQQSRRRADLHYATPLLSWLITYPVYDSPELSHDFTHAVERGRAMAKWWRDHASETQDQREAEAIQTLLEGPLPSGERLLYAQWLLNRSLHDVAPTQWRHWAEQRADWSRLAWVCQGFQQAGHAIEAPWDGKDVAELIAILGAGADVDADYDPAQGYLQSNALWLLERLAPEQPLPALDSWLGPWIGYPWAKPFDWQLQTQRWSRWWEQRNAQEPLRDPTEATW